MSLLMNHLQLCKYFEEVTGEPLRGVKFLTKPQGEPPTGVKSKKKLLLNHHHVFKPE